VKAKRIRHNAVGPRGFTRWVQPTMAKYLMACCDCCLVHEMQFRIDDKQRVQFRARRAEAYTLRERKRAGLK
jgi:hypothetical protein